MKPILIISAGRPHCTTAKLLLSLGIDGFVVCVREDDSELEGYVSNFGDKVVTYDYDESMMSTDMMDNFDNPVGGAAPARNAAISIAAERFGGKFWLLDDDITGLTMPKGGSKSRKQIKGHEDAVKMFESVERFADWSGASCVGIACDMQPFPPSKWDVNPYVRAFFLLDSESSPKFRSRMEEDLTYACDLYRNGSWALAFRCYGFQTKGVLEEGGGCSTTYDENGSIRRAAYTVLACPLSSVKMGRFGYSAYPKWKSVVPKIIDGGYRNE